MVIFINIFDERSSHFGFKTGGDIHVFLENGGSLLRDFHLSFLGISTHHNIHTENHILIQIEMLDSVLRGIVILDDQFSINGVLTQFVG